MKKFLSLSFLMLYAILVNAGTITITAPNGGEVWAGCTQHYITWNSSGVSNYYTIDYSTDNGNTWISVTTNLNITNGQYLWTVPNISSTSCLVRVMDTQTPSIFDISNVTFSITPAIIITSPNGGESWEGGTTKTISWVFSGTTNYFDLYYSLNAGSSWTSIQTNYYSTTGQYSWAVPNSPSSTCLIKVSDHTNTTCMVDISDNLFTITPATPSITVNSPNTNITAYVGNNYNITWSSSYVTSNALKIDYSINNGSTWIPIVANTQNTGSYTWLVPNTPSTQCLVKITDLGNPLTYDVSNTTFTIATPWINVTSPNGGETYGGCSSKTVTWTAAGTSGYFKVQYTTDNGQNWTTLTSSTSSTSYSWNPVPSLSSANCLVKVSDANNTAYVDSSNAVFTILPNTDIIITSPNGGEQWEAGTSRNITWVAASSSSFSVYYSINGGSSWNILANNYYSTTLNWSVIPNTPSTTCLIKVVDYNNSCIFDISDANFTITPPTPVITVTSPNTATTRYIGQSGTITWTSNYLTSSYVAIDYTYDNGTTWQSIASVTENDGSYTWITPNTPSTLCRVRVSEYLNPVVKDESDVNFTIAQPWITVTSPNGGEIWKGCTNKTITWTAGGTSTSFRLSYSINNGATWNYITTVSSAYSYSWTQVADSASTQVLIKVADNNNLATNDSSNAVFTILKNVDIVITAPNGGESWEVGTSHNVTWVSEPTTSYYDVLYSTNSGSTWSSLITNTYSTTYGWTIPNVPSTTALVKVRDNSNACIYDISNANFTIAPPTPTITVSSPNTAATRYIGQSGTITWSSAYLTSNFVTILYTHDNGATWDTIAAITENDNSYAWVTPNTPSTQCRVKVCEYLNPAVKDESDINFTIAPPFITVTAPNGGEIWKGCTNKTISWTSGGTSSSYRLSYSVNNGATWNYITSVSSSTSYSWTQVADSASTQVLIKVADNNNLATNDSSNAVFTILKNTDIVVTAPNGGESWEVGTSHNITWVNETSSSQFNVSYSTNGGSSWSTLLSSTYSTSYGWTIPNAPSTTALVKIGDYNNSCIYDISNANFTIAPPTPTITVTSPNTAATRYIGQSGTITWSSAYLTSSFVSIDYTYDNGATWQSIAAITENDNSYSWVTPNTPSTQCRVRISEYNNPAVKDESDINFIIAPPFITVTAPNGGEIWKGCSNKTISWSSGGTSTSYRLSYSVNNGQTWNYITTVSSAYSYSWPQVADSASTQVLIKVADNNNLSTYDSSNAVFTILKNTDIVVTAPNGGESWEVGTSHNITWVNEPTSSQFNVSYSTNGGSSWSTLLSSTYSTSYGWTIPNVPSTTALVRIGDYNNSCIYDISNANFTIAPPTPTITVTSPNTAATRYIGQSGTITWSSAYLTSSFVTILYTHDNGATWDTIAAITENDNSYPWITPNTPSTQCRVRISEYNNPAVKDESDVNFTIAPPWITVTAPNGGETITKCYTKTITWNTSGTSGTFRLSYSTDNGSTWSFITTTTSSSYIWSTSGVNTSNACLIKVADNNNQLICDSSNAVFSIIPNTDIIITSPNGGEQWQAGSTKNITWVAAPTSTRFSVYYSIDNGSTWSTIISSTYSLSTSWTVPNSPANSCLIKVVDYDNSCIYDMSDATFAITPGTAQLTAPNGGQNWYYASTYSITWTNQYFNGTFVTLSYSVDSGATWLPIVSATNNTGSYSWQIPATYSNKCLVKVNEYNNPSAFDISDAVFTIAPALTITTPNGNNLQEEWRVCTQTTIQWTTGGTSSNFKIEFSTNGGTSWTTIESSYATSGNTHSYNWSMPNTPSTNCLVRVTDVSNTLKTDVSDAVFTIKPCLIITSPNGGGSFNQGTNQNITWTSDGASNYYNIDYTTDGGTNWTNIIFNTYITTNSYSWTVPSVVSSNCKIRITDYINNCKNDVSDNTFSIGMPAPVITVTAPNGGETLTGCNASNITWTATNTSNYYTIEYSTNNGSTWNTIISNLNTVSGIYAWTVPNVQSAQCLVRVKDYNNNSISDVSNAVFTINQSVTATITAGGPTSFCSGGSVVLTSSSATGNIWYPGGQTTQSITVSSTAACYVVVTVNSCSATSNTINVSSSPVPATPVATSNSPVPLNGTVELYSSTVPNATYNWTGPNSYTASNQNPMIPNATTALNGTYSVRATVNGCTSLPGTTTVTVTSTPGNAQISGNILTETGQFISGVKVKLTGTATDSVTTNGSGAYLFNVLQGQSYVVTPTKNNDVLTSNGISTLDIVLMQRHILSVQPLNSPYKIIAADVDGSQSVSNMDIVLTRSLILQNITQFPGNNLWKFVNSDFTGVDPMNPFPFEQSRSYSSASNAIDQHFIGVKLGDVNNSWNPNIAKSLSSNGVTFSMDQYQSASGQFITVPVKVNDFNSISGLQFTIEWDASVLNFVSTNNALLDMSYGNGQTQSGKLAALWSTENLNGLTLADGSIIFNLVFEVVGQTGSSSPITFSSSITSLEAYDNELAEMTVNTINGFVTVDNLTYITENFVNEVANVSAHPNPFTNNTNITFNLLQDDKLDIEILDIYGKKVGDFSEVYTSGTHLIRWEGNDLNGQKLSNGTYFFSIKGKYFNKALKLVLLK